MDRAWSEVLDELVREQMKLELYGSVDGEAGFVQLWQLMLIAFRHMPSYRHKLIRNAISDTDITTIITIITKNHNHENINNSILVRIRREMKCRHIKGHRQQKPVICCQHQALDISAEMDLVLFVFYCQLSGSLNHCYIVGICQLVCLIGMAAIVVVLAGCVTRRVPRWELLGRMALSGCFCQFLGVGILKLGILCPGTSCDCRWQGYPV